MRQFPRVSQLMVCAILGAVFTAGAAGIAEAENTGDGRKANVNRICSTVRGLTPGEAHFDRCVMSLADTLAKQDRAQRIDRDRQGCAARGLKPGTRDFAVCVLDASPGT